jgi:hypothetical protein
MLRSTIKTKLFDFFLLTDKLPHRSRESADFGSASLDGRK